MSKDRKGRSATSGVLSRPEPVGQLVPDPPTRSYRSKCREWSEKLQAGGSKTVKEREANLKGAQEHADSVDKRNKRHRLAAGRLEIQIAAERRQMLALALAVDQRDQFLQQRDRHFDARHEQRDRHHDDRMRGFQRRTDAITAGEKKPDDGRAVRILIVDARGVETPVSSMREFYARTAKPTVGLPGGDPGGPVPTESVDGGSARRQNGSAHR